jgi:hypothetical protein
MDDQFYQAAFDRALVLLQLGRCEDALNSYLLAIRYAPPAGIPEAQRRGFLGRLERLSASTGRPGLAGAVRSALAR